MYKIFVVEDDAVIARAVVEHIASWGWEARKAEDLTRVSGIGEGILQGLLEYITVS